MHEEGVDPSPLVVNPDWIFLGFMAVAALVATALVLTLLRSASRNRSCRPYAPTVARTCANKVSDRRPKFSKCGRETRLTCRSTLWKNDELCVVDL